MDPRTGRLMNLAVRGSKCPGPLQARSHASHDLYWEPGAWERAWSGPGHLLPRTARFMSEELT